MAQDPKIRSTVRPPARPEAIASTLQTKLEDEAYVLESLVAGLSRDKAPPELWALLHQAAARDERIPDLAFAYERLLQDRKFKYLTSALQVEILMYAATFFADVFGDLDGATGLLDQVLAHNPSHPEAFAKMEAVLAASGNGMKLADVYAAQAFHRQDKDEQLALLSRAAELADGFADEHERAIKIYQALLRVEPTNERARSSLEARLGQAGKFRELARLLEQSLTSAPEPSLETATGIRERLIALYVGELGEPERALPHSEEILRQNPAHELGRRTAHRLVSHKPLAGRAAGALADAYEELGTFPEAAAMLEVSLESLRGSKRTEGQKRLGILKQDKLGDQAGAHPLFEAVVALDPGDDEVRRRYIDLSKQLGKQLEAARLLSRAATGVKETALKARLGTEVGEIYLAGNDTKRARSAFASVVDTARSDDPAVLPAARALAGLYADGKEQKPLAQMLELLSRIEPHETARSAAAERLGQVAEDLDDKARAISAYRSLLGSPLHEQALEGLERLYAATEAYAELVDVLEKRADLQTNASTARALALRAAELRTAHTKDRARAISAWMDFLGIYGSSRDVHAKVVPLLEQEKKWDKLATILAEDLVLAPEPERIPILLKLAQVRLARLEDAAGAIDAYRQVWAIDSKEPTMRQALEKLLGSPDVRLSAASLLEPAYRSEGAAPQLVRVLEVRADSAPTPELRLALFDEATEIALRDLRDPERALELAGRALHEAPFEAPLLGARLEAIDRIAEGAGDAARLAAILSSALGDRPIDSAALLDLAKRTGQALVSAGDRSGALSVFRRALAFEPSSRDLLGRIDGLLAEEGRPEERIVLYRAALREAHLPERRRELYHAIATIERRDLADTAAAIATWRQALAENPADRAAHGALLDAYEIAGDWAALYEELGRTLEGEGGEARAAIVLKMGEVAAKRGDDARALAHFSELFLAGSGKDELLSAMANLAERTGDLDTLEEVLRRRVALSSEAQEECAWLDRLGEMQAERRGDNASGAASWKRAGRVALEALLDDERARALFEKALRAAPADLEAALHLFKLYLQGEIWDKITAVAKVVVEQAADADLAAQRLLEFEPHVHKSGGVATWLSLADGLTATSKRADIAFARARVLASVPSRQREAAATLRELVLARMGDGRAVEAFDAFLAKVDPAEHRDDRRFLLEWKAEHAPEAQRMSALFTWAAAEEASFGDLHAAVAVYRRILAIEPERAPALEATARLLRQLGDAEGALHALTLLRDSSEGASRRERDLEIAELLLTELGRPEEALARVSPLIEAGTADADALGIVYRTIEYPEARENAAGLLERAALGAEDDQQALHILKTLLGMPRAPALEGARRRWFESLLDKYEGEPSVALETALVAVAEVPEDESLWERAEKLARLLEEPAKIAAAYRRVLELPLAGELAASLGRRAVDYQEEWFDDQPTVIALLRSVLAKAPEANWARDRLKLAYGSAERWDDLFALYDEAVLRAETDEQRADLLAEAAEAAKDFAADADRAIGYFERLLALRPRDPRVPVVLERLYEKQGRILPLIDLLTSELAALSGEKAQQLRVRIATLWLHRRNDEQAAFKLLEEALRLEPSRADAFALLEDMVLAPAANQSNGAARESSDRFSIIPELDGESVYPPSIPPPPSLPATSSSSIAPSSIPPAGLAAAMQAAKGKKKKRALSVRERAASLLKDRYVAESRHADLARVLEVELELATNPKERARRHGELLALKHGMLGDDRGAFEHAAALLALDPRTPAHRKTLAEIAERLGAWERFGEVLVHTAESIADPPVVARFLTEAAEVYRDKVGRDDRAIELFSAVLELGPKDRVLALETATLLAALLDRAGRDEERCSVLEKIAVLEGDRDARRAVVAEVARVAVEKIGDFERAIRAWQGFLDEEGDEVIALGGLVGVLRGAGRYEDLISALTKRAALGERQGARADLSEIARVYQEKLGQPDKAAAAWVRVRDKFGVGEDTFVALANLFESMSRWDELGRLVLDETRGLGADPFPDGVEGRLFELRGHAELAVKRAADRSLGARVCQQLFDVGVACWVSPLADDPAGEPARKWADATWWAGDELVRMALEERDYELAVRRMLDGSRIVFDPKKSRQMRRQAALVAADHIGDADRAVAIYRELLAENAGDEVARATIPELARLFGQLGAFGALVDLWEDQASRQGEAPPRTLAAELWARAADLSEKHLGSAERAIANYQKSADAGSQSALRELGRLYRAQGEDKKAAEALERISYKASQEHLAGDTLALVDAYLASGERDTARSRLEQVSASAIEPKPIRARLRAFYREDEDWSRLADLLRVEAEEAEDKATRLDLFCQAAALHLERRGDPNLAIPLLEQARKIDGDDSAIGLTLTRALVSASRFEEASGILRAILERYGHRKPKERALVHFELSRVSLKLGERARALAELDLAAKIDPAHPAILYTLGKLSADEGQLDRAQRTFRALLLVLGKSDPKVPREVSRSEVLFELASIAEKDGDASRAQELIESALHAATESAEEADSFERALRQKGSLELLARSLEARLAGQPVAEMRAGILRDLACVYSERGELTAERQVRLKSLADLTMRELAESREAADAPWEALLQAYEELGDIGKQGEVLAKRIALGDGARPAAAQADALYRLAKIRLADVSTLAEGASLVERALDVVVDLDRAIAAIRPAIQLDPKNENLVRLYERVARGEGKGEVRCDALVRLIELGIASPAESREAVSLALGASDERLAQSILEKVLVESAAKDGDGARQVVWARIALAELVLRAGDVARAADLKEEAAEAADPGERRLLLLDVARAAMSLEQLERAARIYATLRERDPADREIWEPLLRIYRKLEATERLIELIAETLPLIESPTERSRLRLEQATVLLRSEETELGAAGLLRDVLDDDPGQVEAAMLLFKILEKNGRTGDLVTLLERQIDSAKDRSDVASIVSLSMRLGALLEEQKRPDAALDVYRAVLDWDGVAKEPLLAIVRLSEERGDPFEIADALEKVALVETGTEAASIAMRLFTLRNEQGDPALAEKALEIGLRASPKSQELSLLLVARYQARGAYRELSSLLRQAFERAPDNLALLGSLLDAYRQTGDREAAVVAVSMTIEKVPGQAALHRERALLSEALGNSADAIVDFEKALTVGGSEHLQDFVEALEREAQRTAPPADRTIRLWLSEVLCNNGYSDAGRAHLTDLLKRDPKDKGALRRLAKLETLEERWDAASTTYRRLLPLEEGDALIEVALKLADACERASRLVDARSGLERALKTAPSNAAVRTRLREVYEKTGAHGPLALLILEDAAKETDVSGRFDRLITAAGLLLGQEGDPAEAVRVLEEARTLRPEDDDGILLLGRAYVAGGNAEGALLLFQSTVVQRKGKRSKQLSAMHREISRIHLAAGDLASALGALTKAFDMDLHNGEIALELGLLAKGLDDQELASRAFRSVTFMKVAPSGSSDGATPAAKGLSYFLLGQMAREKGDVRKAKLMVQKAVIEDPNLEPAKALLEELKSA